MKRAKDKNDSFRLMGFGHRVYKNYDPRAKVMRDQCYAVLDELGKHDDPLLKTALELERIALQDDYFIEKKLYPNIDFYSGITLKALGFPTDMFTALFALARTVGWVAQWKEMIEDPQQKIGRPRQLYTGPHAPGLCSSGETPRLRGTDATGRRTARSIGVRRPDGTDRSPCAATQVRIARAANDNHSIARAMAPCRCRQHGGSVRGKPHPRGTRLHRPRRHHR